MTERHEAFLADFATMSTHGATPRGGVERQAASAADHENRAWFAGWLEAHGFRVEVDAVGNMFGLAELVPGAPWVLTGSHLDSQPLAGRFDGAYGVLTSAHAAARVVERVRAGDLEPRHNVAVVNWFNEEGSRFAPSLMGSAVFTEKASAEKVLAITDHAGTTVADALAAGLAPTDGPLVRADVAQYAEIHIEQGRSLEEQDTTIGLVTGTWAAAKYQVRVVGEQSHTGSTRMSDRRDALYGAALVIVAARELTADAPVDVLHSSVSELYVLPNSPVTVAREVTMNLDLRSGDEAALARAVDTITERIAEVEAASGCRVELTQTHQWGLLAYQPEGVELAGAAAERLGLSHARVLTLAGHDSTNLKDVVPTIMLFVPSHEGISHNEREFTSDADLLAGLDLMEEVVARMVAGDLGTP